MVCFCVRQGAVVFLLLFWLISCAYVCMTKAAWRVCLQPHVLTVLPVRLVIEGLRFLIYEHLELQVRLRAGSKQEVYVKAPL